MASDHIAPSRAHPAIRHDAQDRRAADMLVRGKLSVEDPRHPEHESRSRAAYEQRGGYGR